MRSAYFPLFWRATGLTNLTESCCPDKAMWNNTSSSFSVPSFSLLGLDVIWVPSNDVYLCHIYRDVQLLMSSFLLKVFFGQPTGLLPSQRLHRFPNYAILIPMFYQAISTSFSLIYEQFTYSYLFVSNLTFDLYMNDPKNT